MNETTGKNAGDRPGIGPASAWWNPRRKRFWIWFVLLLYTLAGFLFAPWIAKRELLALIEDQTGLPASLESLRINPFVLSAEASGFALTETDGAQFIRFDRLYVNLQLSSAIRRALVFREVRLEGPFVSILRAPDGGLNLARLAGQPAAQPATEDAELLRLVVAQLVLADGGAEFTDQVPATDFSTKIGPLQVELTNLSTLPEDSGRQKVTLSTPMGKRLEWSGDLSLNPLASTGRVIGSGPYLPVIYEYLQDQLNFEVSEGEIELAFDYSFSLPPEGEFDLQLNGVNLDVTGIVARTADEPQEFLALPEQSLRGGYLRLADRSAGADSYVIRQARVRVARYPDGSLNLQKLLAAGEEPAPVTPEAAAPGEAENGASAQIQAEVPAAGEDSAPAQPESPVANGDPAAPVPDGQAMDAIGAGQPSSPRPAGAAPEAPGWQLALARLEIDGLAVDFEDQTLRGEPARFELQPVQLEITELSNRPDARLPVNFLATLGAGGRAELAGELSVLPELRFDGKLKLEGIELAAAQPYLAEFAQVAVRSGLLDAGLEIGLSPQEALSADGQFSISTLEIADTIKDERLLGWEKVEVDRLSLSLSGNRLDISQVDVLSPYARLLIDTDATTNFQQLLIAPEAAEAPPAGNATPAVAPGPPLAVTVGRIVVADGASDFTDLSLPFPFETRIAALEGRISTLSTTSREPASVDLEGKVDEYGLAEIKGKLTPADPTLSTDLRVLFRNVELPDLSPYTVKFAGRRIDDGRLELDLRYRIDRGKLRGDNSVVIDRLTLGEKQDYPGAANLPLGLAVALLKQPDGTIDIDLPITGDVNDPQFSIGGVVFRAFVNLITKAATAPFKLLAGLVGSQSEDIDLIEFRPGESGLSPPEQEKLAKLAEALALRPQLSIGVPAVVDPEADAAALRAARVAGAIEALLSSESGRRAEDLLTARERRAVEELATAQLPEGALDAARAASQVPEDPARPEGRQVLDEPAYIARLREQLIAAQRIAPEELASLGEARAAAVASALTADGEVLPERITLSGAGQAKETDGGWIPLKLEAKAASGS